MPSQSLGTWWDDLYGDKCGQLCSEFYMTGVDPAISKQTVAFLTARLNLRAGQLVFDQGCGTGRLSMAFLAHGLRVYGIDFSSGYTSQARIDAAEFVAAGTAQFVTGDFHLAAPPSACDAVVSWWSCLGYNMEDDRNMLPLWRAFESLKPGGWFAMDTMNMAALLKFLRVEDKKEKQLGEGTLKLCRTSRLDLVAGVLHQEWRFILPNSQEVATPSATRLYLPHEWARMLRDVGFQELQFFGDDFGAALTQDSPRCIILAQKPLDAPAMATQPTLKKPARAAKRPPPGLVHSKVRKKPARR